MEYKALPDPDFFSTALTNYLQEISDEIGRRIVFAHMTEDDVKGRAFRIPGAPVAVIVLNSNNINPFTYNPQRHDPIIAHEATHHQVAFEGWHDFDYFSTITDEISAKMEMIQNWLIDPVINKRITEKGFSLGPDRYEEIKKSTDGLEQRLWSKHLRKNPFLKWLQIRVFVSFSLEPDIAETDKIAFRQAFIKDLPELYSKANDLLRLVQANGFETPAKYKQTLIQCMKRLRIDTQHVKFDEVFLRYTREEQDAFLATKESPEINWGE